MRGIFNKVDGGGSLGGSPLPYGRGSLKSIFNKNRAAGRRRRGASGLPLTNRKGGGIFLMFVVFYGLFLLSVVNTEVGGCGFGGIVEIQGIVCKVLCDRDIIWLTLKDWG